MTTAHGGLNLPTFVVALLFAFAVLGIVPRVLSLLVLSLLKERYTGGLERCLSD